MLLTQFIRKPIFVNNTPRGLCLGGGLVLKSGAIKYLFCTENPASQNHDFAIGVSSVEAVQSNGVYLTRLRPVLPKNYLRLFLGTPVYSHEGAYKGDITDGEVVDFKLVKLFTDQEFSFPLSAISAYSDAVILKKSLPYPIGQRIPAPAVPLLNKFEPTVTRAVLKGAIENEALIRLTLSLAPFSLESL